VRQEAWEQMEQMARNDPLTGLPNHRVTIERLQETLADCQQAQTSCALLFVDIDHFKHINDCWGHQAGDTILYEVGQRLQRTLRSDDIIGRYGGEEFVIILPHTDLQQAKNLAESVRRALTNHSWSDEGGEKTNGSQPLTVTASIGVAAYRLHGITTAALLEAADSAMYQAKHSGRNRVCVASHVSRRLKELLEEEKVPPEEVMALQALAAMALAHDGGISAHGHRLVRIAGAISARLHCSQETCHLVRMAAILHDIGKIGISNLILQKPGPLTEEEWQIMHQHPIMGYHILVQIGGIFQDLATLVVAHHERWDGQGYPLGLAGQGIPLGARILAVVDAYDAMTSLRVYHQPLSEDEAREELQRGAGCQFDPQVVEAFIEQLDAEDEQA
jgi:diguanylate cyclase (GGDEF)-like protein